MRKVPMRGLVVLSTAVALMVTPGPAVAQSPAPSGGDELDAVLAAVELMNMVPAGIMETCVPGSPSLDGQIAVAQCSTDSAIVIYADFRDAASPTAAYAGVTGGVSIEAGGATSCEAGAYQGAYAGADGSPAGHVTCQQGDTGPLLVWTDDRNLVLGVVALSSGGDFAALHDQWLHARLDGASPSGASPSPSGAAPSPSGAALRRSARCQQITFAIGRRAPGRDTLRAGRFRRGDRPVGRERGCEQRVRTDRLVGEPGDRGSRHDVIRRSPNGLGTQQSDGGAEWIELTYERALRPTAIDIWESSGSGFVQQVEAWDDGDGRWVTLWQGADPSASEQVVFSPPLTAAGFATKRIRVTIDTGVPDWNESMPFPCLVSLPDQPGSHAPGERASGNGRIRQQAGAPAIESCTR